MPTSHGASSASRHASISSFSRKGSPTWTTPRCDACGSSNQIAEEMSWRRMERAGVRLTSTNAIVAELVKNWASPAGAVAFPLLT